MKKTLLLSFLGLSLAMQTFADKTVYINGAKAEKDLAQISFAGDNAVLKYADASTFTLDMELVEIDFSDGAGIDGIGASLFSVNTLVDDQLKISGADDMDTIMIISADGKVVYTGIADGSEVNISTSNLSHGSYLLKVGHRTIKFIKK